MKKSLLVFAFLITSYFTYAQDIQLDDGDCGTGSLTLTYSTIDATGRNVYLGGDGMGYEIYIKFVTDHWEIGDNQGTILYRNNNQTLPKPPSLTFEGQPSGGWVADGLLGCNLTSFSGSGTTSFWLNQAPTNIALSVSSINENVAANTTIGTLSTTDPDAGNTFTYSLVSGSGSTDNTSFNISGNSLRITNSPNYEAKNSYSVRIRTTDEGSLTYEKVFTITIADVAELPTATTTAANSITTTAGRVNATVTDNGAATTTRFRLHTNQSEVTLGTGGNVQNAGSVSAGAGSTAVSYNYTSLSPGNTYYYRVEATNSLGTSNGSTLSFTTLPDPPTITTASNVTATGFTINWTASASYLVDGYRLDVATDAGFTSILPSYNNLFISGKNTVFQAVTGLTAGTQYWYRLRAENIGGASVNSTSGNQTTSSASTTVSSINRAGTSPTNSTGVNFTVTFAANVTGVDASDFTLTKTGIADGTIGTPTGSGTTWTVPITGISGDGTLRLDFTGTTGVTPNVSATYTSGQVYTIDNTAPAVTSVSVPSNATYIGTQQLDFTVNFSDNITVNTTNGIPQLALTIGSASKSAAYVSGTGTSALVFRYTVTSGDTDTDGIFVGTLSANGGTLRDAAGNNAALSLSNVGNTGSIFVDAVAPTVTGVTSSNLNGTYKKDDVISIQVNFSEVVNVTGTPELYLNLSPTPAFYDSGSGTTTLTFKYTVEDGMSVSDLDYYATVSMVGGTMYDVNGNPANRALPTPGGTGSLGANKNIVIDGVVPTVSGVTSSTAHGSYKAGDAISIQVNFSEAVIVTGTPQLTLETGTTDRVVDYASGSGTSSLTFTYTIQAGDVSSDLDYTSTTALALNGGTIKDGARNSATLTLASPGAANSLGANKNIVIDTTVPTVSGVTSSTAHGTYKTSDAISIQVNFSEAVTVTGTPQLTLETGTTDRTANYSSGTGTSTLTFSYIVQAGDSSSDLEYISTTALALNSGTIRDAAGNDAILTLPFPGAANSLGANKNIVIDGIAPTVAITSNKSSLKIGETATITFTFSEDPGATFTWNGTLGDVTISVGTLGAISGTGLTRTATFTPTANTNGGVASITVASGSYYDAAGNGGAAGATPSLIFDTRAPSAPVAVTPANGATTNDNTPTYSGTAEASSTVSVTVDGSSAGTTTADGSGNWSHTPSTPLADGSHTVSATATDAAGNTSVNSNTNSFTVDTTPPAAPVVAAPANGATTNDNTPTYSGTAEASNTVAITINGSSAGTTTANGSGNWSYTPSTPLADGSHTVSAMATDAVGNTSTASSTNTFTVDTTPPAAPVVSAPANGSATGDNTPAYSGTAAASTTVSVIVDGTTIGTTTADGSGNWSFTPSTPLSDGPHTVTATATDLAGNTSANSATNTFTVDTSAPTVSSITRVNTSPTNSASVGFTVTFSQSVTGVTTSDFTLTGTGTANGTISGISGSGSTYTVAVNTISGDGTIRVDLNSSGTGIVNILGTSISGGYTSGQAYTIDHTSPAVTGVTSSTANGTYIVGNVIAVQVNFNEAVTVTGTPLLTLETGTTDRVVNYASGSGTGTLTFNYTVQAGDVSSDLDYTSTGALALNGGSIKDAAGNDATLTLAAPAAANSLGNNKALIIDGAVPTVNSVSVPSNATYTASQNLDFTINFSENITVNTGGGTPQLALTIGSTSKSAAYLSGSGTSALVFRYTVASGDTDDDGITVSTLSLNGGTLKDAAGNDATLTLNSVSTTASVLVDAVVPTVNTVSVPANATYTVSQNLDFIINFSENITVNSGGGIPQLALTIGSTGKSAAYISGSGTAALVFRYTVASGDADNNGITVGTLSLNGGTLKDAAGNNATLTLNSVGSTTSVLVDAIVPTVTSVTVPTNGTYKNGDQLNFIINLSENVTVTGTPNLGLTLNTGGSVNAAYLSGSGTSALTFRYTIASGNFDADGITVGTLSLNSGSLKDAAGNDVTLTLNNVGPTTGVLVDAVTPTLSMVSIASNNTVQTLAKIGDQLTVTFTASEAINTPVVTIAGQTATVANTSGNTYTGKYTMTGSGSEGIVTFNISFSDLAGNSGMVVTATTDASAVTFDKTPPAVPLGLTATSGNTQITLSWTANIEGDPKAYKVFGGTSANPATLLTSITAPATTYTHTGLTNGTTYYYRILATDNAGNEGGVSADVTGVPKADQTITFAALTARTYGDSDFDPAASSGSGLPVSYSSDNTSVATIVAGKIRITGAGTATITASQAGNAEYTAATNQTQTLTVNKKTLTATLAGTVSKTYDGTTTATLADANYALSGIVGSDNVTVSGIQAAYNDKHAGSSKTVTVTGLSLAGTSAANYSLSAASASAAVGIITKKVITVSLNAAPLISRMYDGGTTATLASANYTLNELETGDAVTVSSTAAYDNKNAGTAKTITANTFVLAGAQKDNYSLSTTTATTTGNITAKPITLALNAAPVITRVYNGTTAVTLAAGNYSLNGLETGDVVTVSGTAAFDNQNVGTGKMVTASSFVLAGAQKDNYSLSTTTATTTGTITAKPITLALNASPAITKVYDGTTAAPLAAGNYSLSGLETGDVVTVSGTAAYDTKNAGTAKTITANTFVVAGAQKDNYSLSTTTATTTGTVDKKALTVAADNKTKVQGTENPVFTITYSGFAGGENQNAISTAPIAVSTATLSSPAGTYPITVSGGAAVNYSFNYSAGTLTVTPGAPTNITLAAAPIYENHAPGVIAGTLSSVSENPDATFTYSLVNGTGSTDNTLFTISGNTLRTTAPLDYEQKPTYSILVRSTTQQGLSLEKQFTVAVRDVNEAPTLAAISNQTMCFTTAQQAISLSGISAGPEASQTTQLTVSSTNTDLFDQLSINGNTLNYRIKAGQSGTATVTVTVSDNGGTDNGGTDTYSRSFNLVVNPLPLVTISSNKGTTELSKGDVLVLTATGGDTYSWVNSPGILSGQNTANLTIRPEQTTTYRVAVTSATSCITEQEITVNVMADYLTINSTNLLSPNGDGKNDNFIIKNIDMYPNNEVKIYDRAGRLIYSKVNYTDEWNGTFQGSPLAEDTYYYIVDFGQGKPKLKGFITIVRD